MIENTIEIKTDPVKPVFQFNPDLWDDDDKKPITNSSGVKLCKIADPDCEACQ